MKQYNKIHESKSHQIYTIFDWKLQWKTLKTFYNVLQNSGNFHITNQCKLKQNHGQVRGMSEDMKKRMLLYYNKSHFLNKYLSCQAY